MSIDAAEAAVRAAEAEERLARSHKHDAMAALLREQILDLADRYPTITGISYESTWEYDDESSFYWYTSFRLHPEHVEHDVDVVEELSQTGDDLVEACKLLFGSEDYGEIEISDLRS